MNEPIPSTNVKQLRSSKNLTVRQVCAAVDVAESTVLRWEAGTMKPHLPLDKVDIMLELFECDFKTLYNAFQQTWQEKDKSTTDTATTNKIPVSA